jgi:protein-L-isoaspartate(D-aspartate) O-methyltransferase
LKQLGTKNIFFKHADGGLGWEEQAPFDRILVTANAPEIPDILLKQLANKGIMIIPVGDDYNEQVLKKIIKNDNDIKIENLMKVRFVPLVEGKNNK